MKRIWIAGVMALFAITVLVVGIVMKRSNTVILPQRLMLGSEILEEIYKQTGQQYAYPSGSLVRQIDVSEFEGKADLLDLAALLAPEARFNDDILVLAQPVDDGQFDKLKKQLLDDDFVQRRNAVYLLGNMKNPAVIPMLYSALNDKNDIVRHHALRSLDRIERDFRHNALPGRVSIFGLHDTFPAETLLDIMAQVNDRSENEWIWSAGLFGRRADDSAGQILGEALIDGYDGVRKVAEWALDRIERPSVSHEKPICTRYNVDRLLTGLEKEVDENCKAQIVLGLGRTGGDKAWKTLLGLLEDENPLIRRAALRALRRCPDHEAVPALMHWLTASGVESEDRNLAAVSLGMIASQEVVKALVDYFGSDADPVMTASVLALNYTADPRGLDALIGCVSKSGRSGGVMRGYASMGLARLGTAEAVEALLKYRNPYDNTARSVAHAAIRLSGAWSQSAVDAYVKAAERGHSAAAHGLELADDPRAVDAMVNRLPESKGSERLRILQSLGRIGDPSAIPALVEVMNSAESTRDRYEAMRNLRWRWFWHRPDVKAALKKHQVFSSLVKPVPTLEEQEENTWVLRRWPVDFDDSRACGNSYESGLVYEDTTGHIVRWGSHGLRGDSPQTPYTWLYNPNENLWRETDSAVSPFGACGTWGMAYDKAAEATVSVQSMGGTHGWQWYRARTLRPAVPWVYRSRTDTWVPMQRVESTHGPGQRGFHAPAYHEKAQVVFFYGGQWGNFNSGDDGDRGWIYDTSANRWFFVPASDPFPGKRAHHGMTYMPNINRILMVGGSYFKADKKTWLYDLENNAWTDTEATGDIPRLRLPLVYDPVTGTALRFESSPEDGAIVSQYHPDSNIWTSVQIPEGMRPHHSSHDVVYDERNNVFVMDGGHLSWDAGHIAVRETWTYRLRNLDVESQPVLEAPQDPILTVDGDDVVWFNWKPVSEVSGYKVYRGRGPKPWQVEYELASPELIRETAFSESLKDNKEIFYYRVAAVDADGREGPRSLRVSIKPGIVHDVVVSTLPDRTVKVQWSKADEPDVVGYNVYASTVEPGKVHPRKIYNDIRPLQRLTDKPVKGSSFTDKRPLARTEGFFDHELRVYEVRALNPMGIESGSSAMILNIPSSTPRASAQLRTDGTTLVSWDPAPEEGILGYRIYRMDEFNRSMILKLNYVPLTGTSYIDKPDVPESERRRYYVVTVNALGQEGLPSTGAFSFGRP